MLFGYGEWSLHYISFIKSTSFQQKNLPTARNNQLLTDIKDREHDSKSTYSLHVYRKEPKQDFQRCSSLYVTSHSMQYTVGTGTALHLFTQNLDGKYNYFLINFDFVCGRKVTVSKWCFSYVLLVRAFAFNWLDTGNSQVDGSNLESVSWKFESRWQLRLQLLKLDSIWQMAVVVKFESRWKRAAADVKVKVTASGCRY